MGIKAAIMRSTKEVQWIDIIHIFLEFQAYPSSTLSDIPLQPYSHFVHPGVGGDCHKITFHSNKDFGVLDIGQGGLDGTISVGEVESLNCCHLHHPQESFHGIKYSMFWLKSETVTARVTKRPTCISKQSLSWLAIYLQQQKKNYFGEKWGRKMKHISCIKHFYVSLIVFKTDK